MGIFSRHLGKGMVAASCLAIAFPALANGSSTAAAGASAAAAPQSATAAKDGDRLICKRFADTTSRMKSVRACHTKEQWRKIDKGEF